MIRPLRYLQQRLTYANVTASLALFVALGGTGYAATRLPRNSVAGPQIVNGSIRAQDLHSSTRLRTVELAVSPGGAGVRVNGRPSPGAVQVIPGAQPGLYFIRLRRSKGERCLPGGPYTADGTVGAVPVRIAADFAGDTPGRSNYSVAVTRLDGSPINEGFYLAFLCVPDLGENTG